MNSIFEPNQILEKAMLRAAAATGLDASFTPLLRPADPRHGDFQANGALPYARKKGENPRQVATQILEQLKADKDLSAFGVESSIAGPGFINFKLSGRFLLNWMKAHPDHESLSTGAAGLGEGKRFVVDFSAPNTAKQMHVGHLRSTVIGEAICRLLCFTGANVIRDNHLGDWGTQFGILIRAIKEKNFSLEAPGDEPLATLENLYREGQQAFKESEEVRKACREELVKLQQGDPGNYRMWQRIWEISWGAFEKVYQQLGIQFDEVLGESFYRDKVERVYKELAETGIAQESEGALVVFHPEHKRFAKQPFIVRKADGASNYATTDLATILYRTEHFKADGCIYVVDARQSDHFEQLFLTVEKLYRKRGWQLPELNHVSFGTVLGADGKPIKTREGGTVKLQDLLDEAIVRARAIVDEKNADLAEEERARIAEVVGLGSVKYADLAQNRTSDYIFAWDKMLSLEGNTAPYLLYAVARIHSIFRKAGLQPGEEEADASALETDEEIALARKLVAFPSALKQARSDLRPHVLCQYLYELSGQFSSFYNANRVIVEEPATRARRLMLCSRTLLILQTGLNLLGLETLERM